MFEKKPKWQLCREIQSIQLSQLVQSFLQWSQSGWFLVDLTLLCHAVASICFDPPPAATPVLASTRLQCRRASGPMCAMQPIQFKSQQLQDLLPTDWIRKICAGYRSLLVSIASLECW